MASALPRADPSDRTTILAGVAKRFAFEPPTPKPELFSELLDFTKEFVTSNLTPISSDADLSVEHWLANTNYPQWRRNVLQRLHDENLGAVVGVQSDGTLTSSCRVKSFIKDESYPEYKHARAINSRHDLFKIRLGPVVKHIEKALFKLKWFIKYIPVKDRARIIQEVLSRPGATFTATDYSQYESHFTKAAMEIEFILYEFMTQNLSCQSEIMSLFRDVIASVNLLDFKYFSMKIEATRMSGEMVTSLGNGFANLMLMLFVLKKMDCSDIAGFVEGDDGLFRFEGICPTVQQFADLGFTIKLEKYDNLMEASFCGLLSPEEIACTVTNPIDVLLEFGWTRAQYALSSYKKHQELLKCKSLSMLYQYPGCPIIQELALYGLRVTSGCHITIPNGTSLWEREQIIESLDYYRKYGPVSKPISIHTRNFVEKMFKITVSDQLAIESYLKSLDVVCPLNIPQLDNYVHPHTVHYWTNYVHLMIPETLRYPNIQCH